MTAQQIIDSVTAVFGNDAAAFQSALAQSLEVTTRRKRLEQARAKIIELRQRMQAESGAALRVIEEQQRDAAKEAREALEPQATPLREKLATQDSFLNGVMAEILKGEAGEAFTLPTLAEVAAVFD